MKIANQVPSVLLFKFNLHVNIVKVQVVVAEPPAAAANAKKTADMTLQYNYTDLCLSFSVFLPFVFHFVSCELFTIEK